MVSLQLSYQANNRTNHQSFLNFA